MFGTFEVHAGDFKPGKHHQALWNGWSRSYELIMKSKGRMFREKIRPRHIAHVEVASEESINRWGLGAAGFVMFGAVGLLAGLAQKKQVTFICVLTDGRKFLATAPAQIYTAISAPHTMAKVRTGGPQQAQTIPDQQQAPSQPPIPPNHRRGQHARQGSPTIAALLSLLIPGLGQLYTGRLFVGIVWFMFTLIGYVAFIVPGLILHIICIFHAATSTRR